MLELGKVGHFYDQSLTRAPVRENPKDVLDWEMIPNSAVLTTASGPYGEKPLVFRRTFFREVG
jgi:hypothetical protein